MNRKYRITSVCLLLCAFSFSTQAQKTVDKFISKYLKHENTTALSLPGWLFEGSVKFAAKMEEDEEMMDYAKLSEYVKNIRVFVMEEGNAIPENAVKDLMKAMTEKDGYDEYIRIRSKGTNVNLFAVEKKEKIKQLVFFIDDEDDFIMLRLKLDLPLNLFEDFNYKLRNEIRS